MAKLQLEQVLVQQAQGLKTEVTAPAPTKPSRDFKSRYQSCTASKQTNEAVVMTGSGRGYVFNISLKNVF